MLFSLALALSSLPLVSNATAAAGGDRALREVEAAIAFRENLGLRADRDFVGATFAGRGFSNARWGIPLSDEEAREVKRRADVQDAAGRALRAAARDTSAAGAYFDQDAGGVPVFLTAGDPGAARRALRGLLPEHIHARYEQVRFSTDQLEALQERVNDDLRAGALRELGVSSTAIDAKSNVVAVGTALALTDAMRAALHDRYGAGVTLVHELAAQGGDGTEPCVSRRNCRPAKAGLQIEATGTSNQCTTGFMVRVAHSSAVRLLTAGHCLGMTGGTGTSRTWKHNDTTLGWSEHYVWGNGADADVGIINPNAASVGGERNLLFGVSPSNVIGITGWKPTAAQVQGSIVCRMGAVSGARCGMITLTDRTRDVDGRTIDHQWVVDFDACPGDSGGPYVLDTTAYGLHTDSTYGCDPSTNQAWYSPVGWALSVLSKAGHPVELCTEATCGSHVNAWTASGSLSGAVAGTTLVELADGRVLNVGGTTGAAPSALDALAPSRSPQVFDPSTSQWSDTAVPPWQPDDCGGQFGVRLADGRVLVGGGTSADGGPGSDRCTGAAYIYDPNAGADGSWTDAASMPVPIQSAGAVLLADGRVFVTGGSGNAGSQSIALAYAPAADTWSTLAPAPAAGIAPLVRRLGDGRVLVSGGHVTTDPAGERYAHAASAFLYNPATNSWASTANAGNDGAAGLLLANGRVVVAGGRQLGWTQGQTASFGTGVAVLNPSTGAWSQLAPLRSGRARFTLVELSNGQLLAAGGLVAGGTDPLGEATDTAEVYDWASNAWYPAPRLRDGRAGQGSAVLDDGRVLAAGGGTATTETYTPGDVLPPTTSGLQTRTRSGATISTTTVPATLSWGASDAGGAGVGTYDIARSIDGGAFATIASTLTSTSVGTTLVVGHTYRFQVRARDWAGNVGPWTSGAAVKPSLVQQTSSAVRYSGTWRTSSNSSYSGGSVRYATKRGASASYTFTGRGIELVTTRGSARGSAKVYIDGVLAAKINLHANNKTNRYVAFQRSWGSQGTHTIRVVVLGTAGHPRVDIDAFVVLQNG